MAVDLEKAGNTATNRNVDPITFIQLIFNILGAHLNANPMDAVLMTQALNTSGNNTGRAINQSLNKSKSKAAYQDIAKQLSQTQIKFSNNVNA